jgi:hypothetical protein
MYRILMIIAVLAVAGCGNLMNKPVILENTKFVVVDPPAELFVCPDAVIPTVANMQSDVSQLLVDLYQRGELCQLSMLQIQDFIAKQKAIYEAKNKKP